MSNRKEIYCCGCEEKVQARLTGGVEIYPHIPRLKHLPYWKCDTCGNYVGCHHKTSEPTTPLGDIPTPAIRKVRSKLHAVIDPIWKNGRMSRRDLYKAISKKIGRSYHTASIKTEEEAEAVLSAVKEIST